MNDKIILELKKQCMDANDHNEIPIAVAVKKKKTDEVYYFRNTKETDNSILGHAEINAIKFLNDLEKDFRLNEYEVLVTTEPCIMCLGALIESRVNKITILSKKKKNELMYMDFYLNSSNTIIQYNEITWFEDVIKNFFKNKRIVI